MFAKPFANLFLSVEQTGLISTLRSHNGKLDCGFNDEPIGEGHVEPAVTLPLITFLLDAQFSTSGEADTTHPVSFPLARLLRPPCSALFCKLRRKSRIPPRMTSSSSAEGSQRRAVLRLRCRSHAPRSMRASSKMWRITPLSLVYDTS